MILETGELGNLDNVRFWNRDLDASEILNSMNNCNPVNTNGLEFSFNFDEIINGIITKTNTVIHGVVNPMLTLITSFVLIFGIMTALLFHMDSLGASMFH